VKILQTIASTDPKSGGPVEVIRQFAPHAIDQGHTVDCLSLDAPDSDWLEDLPFKTHACGPGKGTFGSSHNFKGWLAANIRSYDVVVANGIWQYPTLATRVAAVAAGIPFVVFTHGMLDPWFQAAYPLKHLKKVLYWRLAESQNLRAANAVAFTCEEERALAKGSFKPYSAREVIVPLGTSGPSKPFADLEEAFWEHVAGHAEASGLADGAGFILFLGRLHEKKGPDLLMEAFAKVAPNRFHLVYVGPDNGVEASLRRRASELKLDGRVHWLGMMKGDAKWGAYVAADAFALPSHQENFGIAVAEALACGCPVLISNKVNIWREISDAHAAFVNSDDASGTERSLKQWFEAGGETRAIMRANAMECFDTHYESRAAAAAYSEMLNKVVSG
jgi:glycosyltransferase involved in cell wall biosynthesis